MHVVLGVLRDVVVDDDVHRRDVEASRGDVRGDQDAPFPGLELVQRAQPLGLGHLPVNGHRAEPQVPRDKRQFPRLVTRACEHHRRAGTQLVEQVVHVAVLVLRRDEQVVLLQRVHGAVLGAHLHLHGVPQARALQLGDFARHRRGKQLRPAVARHDFEDLVDLLLEVQVEQTVSLVQAQHLELLQPEALGVREVVHHAPGRAHDDVRPLSERDTLRHHVDAADERRRLDADAGAQRLELLGDLDGELARWREHQREKRLGAVQELLQDGQRERAGLAGTGLREADDVLALQRLRDGLRLNRGGCLPSQRSARLRELVAHAQRRERLDSLLLLGLGERRRHRGRCSGCGKDGRKAGGVRRKTTAAFAVSAVKRGCRASGSVHQTVCH